MRGQLSAVERDVARVGAPCLGGNAEESENGDDEDEFHDDHPAVRLQSFDTVD